MRILIVTHSLGTGGTDRVAVHIANGFASRFETVLLSVRKPAESSDLPGMIDPAVSHISLGRQKASRTRDLLSSVGDFIREVRRLQPDIILATGNNNSLFAMAGHLANPNPQGRFAVKITNPIVRRRDKPLGRALRTALYRIVLGRCARILALSSGEAGEIASLYPALADRIRVVCNPYVTDAMIAVGNEREPGAAIMEFLAVGRLHDQKNLPLLLNAWTRGAPDGARLRIAGEGPLRDMLANHVRILGIEDEVTFLGYRSDIPDLLRSSDCLVLSSDYEGLPAVVLEALAAGCPVIATDCFPAASELVGRTPSCRVVPLRSSEPLSEAIRDLAGGARPEPASLQALARPYTIANAIESHLVALSL